MTTSRGWIAILQRLSDIYICGNIDGNILAVMLWLLYKKNILSSIGLNIVIGLEFGCSRQYVLLTMGDYIEKLDLDNTFNNNSNPYYSEVFYTITTALLSIYCHQ